MNSDGLKHMIKCFPELEYCLLQRRHWNSPSLWLFGGPQVCVVHGMPSPQGIDFSAQSTMDVCAGISTVANALLLLCSL